MSSERSLAVVQCGQMLRQLGMSTWFDFARDHDPTGSGPTNVFGVHIAPDGKARVAVGGPGATPDQLLSLRGLADMVGADDVYALRSRRVPEAIPQLASRLGLLSTSVEDLEMTINLPQNGSGSVASATRVGFDVRLVEESLFRRSDQAIEVRELARYAHLTYWLEPDHLAPTRLVANLSKAARMLRPDDQDHLALLFDCAWLLMRSLGRVVFYLRTTAADDISFGLSAYLAGSRAVAAQRREMAAILDRLKDSKQIPKRVAIDVNPKYFGQLLELLARLLRRGDIMSQILVTLEVQARLCRVGSNLAIEDAVGESYDKLGAKLGADVVSVLVNAAGLNGGLGDRARRTLMGTTTSLVVDENVNGDSGALF